MGLFRRGKQEDKKSKKKRDDPPAEAEGPESSPQKVGVVSGVLSTPADEAGAQESPFADVVARRFGPSEEGQGSLEGGLPPVYEASGERSSPTPERASGSAPTDDSSPSSRQDSISDDSRADHLRAVEPLFSDTPAIPELEVDSMAHIGRTTIITGNVVAEEDLEIQGTIEGSVRLVNHQVTVGVDGHVKASVEAHTVHVTGRITGDVVANDLVEVEAGGIIGGDVKAPRVIMHDGAILIGGLDMSASLPNAGTSEETQAPSQVPSAREIPRPLLKKVEAPTEEGAEDKNA